MLLEEGQRAPAFSLPDQNNEVVSLADFAGRWVVFWWYPVASSPG